MSAAVGILILVGLVFYGFQRGLRRNREVAHLTSTALEETFNPGKKSYVNIGGAIGYGIEYEDVSGFEVVRGLLTLLPRQAVLYLPFSKLAGREDRLQLTFFCSEMPLGIGTVVREQMDRHGWAFIQESERMQRDDVSHNGDAFRIYSFNPQVAERFKRLLPELAPIRSLRQVTVDHRERSVSAVINPDTSNLKQDLQNFAHILSFLTAPGFGFTV